MVKNRISYRKPYRQHDAHADGITSSLYCRSLREADGHMALSSFHLRRNSGRRHRPAVNELIDQGNHALLSSAMNVGQATAVLPVVSTLSFGFAATVLLSQSAAAHASVLILLALSASLSMYTTTYSVLEYYYLVMLTASDTKVQAEDAAMAKRDGLALKTDATMRQFEPWRAWARNSLWGGVILILAAGAMQRPSRNVAFASGQPSWLS